MSNIILTTLELQLDEAYKDAELEFSTAADLTSAKQAIDKFKTLVDRNQVNNSERNIDWWRKQGWDKFKSFVGIKSAQKSTTQEKRSKVTGNAISIAETDEWLVVVPLDKDASCFYGKQTNWCTAKPYTSHYEQYMHADAVTLIYFLQVATGKKWAIAARLEQPPVIKYFDQNDNQINKGTFASQTNLDPTKYIQLAFEKQHLDAIHSVRDEYKHKTVRLRQQVDATTIPNPDLEYELWEVKDIDLMIQYCANVHKRWDKLERLLTQTHYSSEFNQVIKYATNVVQASWPEFEQQLIATVTNIPKAQAYFAIAKLATIAAQYCTKLNVTIPSLAQAINTRIKNGDALMTSTLAKNLSIIG